MLRDITYNRIHLQRAANELAEYRRLQHYRPFVASQKKTLEEVLAEYPLFRFFMPQDLLGTQADNTQVGSYLEREGIQYITVNTSQRPVWRENAGYNGLACFHFGVDTSGASAYTQFVQNTASATIDGDFTIISLCKIDADYITSGEAQWLVGGQGAFGGKGAVFGLGNNNVNSIMVASTVTPTAAKKHLSPISAAVSEWVVIAVTNDAMYINGVEVPYALNEYLPHCCLDTYGSSVTFYAPEKFKGKSSLNVAISQKLTQPQIQEVTDLVFQLTP